jgi:hypothetical protein
MQLFRRKCLLLHIYSSARTESKQHQQLLLLKNMKHKKTHRNRTLLYRHFDKKGAKKFNGAKLECLAQLPICLDFGSQLLQCRTEYILYYNNNTTYYYPNYEVSMVSF